MKSLTEGIMYAPQNRPPQFLLIQAELEPAPDYTPDD
jgi:hypothetical protein